MHMLIAMAAVTVFTSIVLPCLLFGGTSLCPALEAGCCLAITTRRLPCTIILVTLPSLYLAFYCLLGESGNVAHGRGRSSMTLGGLFTLGCSHMYMCGLMLVLFWLVQAPKPRRGHLPPLTSIVTPRCTGVPCFTVWGRLACFISVPSVICRGGTGSNVCMWCFPPLFFFYASSDLLLLSCCTVHVRVA